MKFFFSENQMEAISLWKLLGDAVDQNKAKISTDIEQAFYSQNGIFIYRYKCPSG